MSMGGSPGDISKSLRRRRALLILHPFCHFTAHSQTLLLLNLRHSSFSNPSIALPTSQLILKPFHRFTYVTAHSPTLLSLYLHHSSFFNPSLALPTSFSNPSIASPTSQLILQPFHHFTYVTAHSPTLPLLYLHHSSFSNPSIALPNHNSFSNPSIALPTSQLILQSFHRFTYITAHSPTFASFQLHHSSFSNPSVASPTSQLILQPFFRFSYVTASSFTSPGEPPMHPTV